MAKKYSPEQRGHTLKLAQEFAAKQVQQKVKKAQPKDTDPVVNPTNVSRLITKIKSL